MCFDVMVTDDAQCAAKHVSAVCHNCTALITELPGDHRLILIVTYPCSKWRTRGLLLCSRFDLGRTSSKRPYVEIIDPLRVSRVLIVARELNQL